MRPFHPPVKAVNWLKSARDSRQHSRRGILCNLTLENLTVGIPNLLFYLEWSVYCSVKHSL